MDSYVEVLVKKTDMPGKGVVRVAPVALAVFFFVIGLQNMWFWAAALLMLAVSYVVYLRTDLEYEYLYVDRELTVDRVMAKSRRKREQVLSLEALQTAAPEGSSHLEAYRGREGTVYDYSSGSKSNKRYVLCFPDKRVIVEGEDVLLKALRNAAPHKVFLS